MRLAVLIAALAGLSACAALGRTAYTIGDQTVTAGMTYDQMIARFGEPESCTRGLFSGATKIVWCKYPEVRVALRNDRVEELVGRSKTSPPH
jgi:hypothetical protein